MFGCVPIHIICSSKTKVIDSAKGWGAIFALHIFDQMMGTSVSLTVILPRVGQDNLARVMITVNGEKGLFCTVPVW